MRRIPHVREMRSTTSRGSAEINLDCEWGADMDLTLQRVQAQIDAVRSQLPTGTTLDARLMNPTLFPVLGFSLTSRPQLAAGAARLRGVHAQARAGAAAGRGRGGDPGRPPARGAGHARSGARCARAGSMPPRSPRRSARSPCSSRSACWNRTNELYLGLADGAADRPRGSARDRRSRSPPGRPVPLGELGSIELAEAPEFVRYRGAARARRCW